MTCKEAFEECFENVKRRVPDMEDRKLRQLIYQSITKNVICEEIAIDIEYALEV